jgi:hypothetical protein
MRLSLTLLLVLGMRLAIAQTNIVVAHSSQAVPAPLNAFIRFYTLKEAYCAISTSSQPPNPCSTAAGVASGAYNIILYGTTAVQLGASTLVWEKAGTLTNPINIYSYNKRVTLTRTASTTNGTMIRLLNVQYVNFFNIEFQNATYGITLDNADYCSITYCKFTGELSISNDDAAIWIGKGASPDNFDSSAFDNSASGYLQASYRNTISHNLITGQKFTDYCRARYNHGLYMSHGNVENKIYGNTILTEKISNGPYPIGEGIHVNHAYQQRNTISRNFIDHYYYKTSTFINCTQGSEHNTTMPCYPNDYDSWQRSRRAFDLISDDAADLPSIEDNILTGNYTYASSNVATNIECFGDPLSFYTDNILRSTNELPSLAESSYSYDKHHYYDPYWNPHAVGAISAAATISGDFDNDGKVDDIAVFYEFPGAVTEIHVWRYLDNAQRTDINQNPYRQDSFFQYMGVKWSNAGLGGFDANKIKGRVISGAYDNSNYKNDIAAIYDNGAGGVQVCVFLWDNINGEFDYYGGGSSWRNIATGFNASSIAGRVVSGDFTGDGLDDIATFYKVGTTGTEVNMFLSTGLSFTYRGGSQNWWSAASGFNTDKYTDRVVSGDFAGDSKDDIAIFFDAGSNATEVEMFISNGSAFTYQGGSNNWWSNVSLSLGNFDSNKIKGRIVSGDFDGDGSKNEVAAFYEGTLGVEVVRFKSTGTKPLAYYGGQNAWWTAQGFDVNRITGSVVAGDFSNGDNYDDIAAFYDYTYLSGNVRTNVWKSNALNAFTYVNEALGYPWVNNSDGSLGRLKVYETEDVHGLIELEREDLFIFPNPASNEFTVRYLLDEDVQVKLSLSSMDGKRVLLLDEFQSKGGHTRNVNVKTLNLKPGLYIIQMQKGIAITVKKVIVR